MEGVVKYRVDVSVDVSSERVGRRVKRCATNQTKPNLSVKEKAKREELKYKTKNIFVLKCELIFKLHFKLIFELHFELSLRLKMYL